MEAPAPSVGVRGDLGSARVFMADSRLALALLNHARYQGLNRLFGVDRAQANLLTGALALGAADAAYEGVRRLHLPALTRDHATFGGMLLNEAALGIGGPGARGVPRFTTLLAFAVAGGVVLPDMIRAAHRARATAHRFHEYRMRLYRGLGSPVKPPT